MGERSYILLLYNGGWKNKYYSYNIFIKKCEQPKKLL